MPSFISPDTLAQKPLIGLMSGTSMDGVDGVLAYFKGNHVEVCASVHLPMPTVLRQECLALNQPGKDELHRAALASNALSELYEKAVQALLSLSSFKPSEIAAIGCHGQTVRHQPREGYTLQLVNGSLLAERSGITTIVDFRSRDISAGGQGAPLVPAFHQAIFGNSNRVRGVLNIGGFSNISVLRSGQDPIGFDCGPGNVLMDAWIHQHRSVSFDLNGAWALTGQVHAGLLVALLAHPFFERIPPRSTGRDDFHLDWLHGVLAQSGLSDLRPEDVQRTLLECSARAISDAIHRFADDVEEVLLCGGGALNQALVQRLQSMLEPIPVFTTESVGVKVDQVEALAFAWLAQRTLMREPGNCSSVTGAAGPRILGAIYLA